MNIAFVSSGSSIHVKKLANGLIKEGHQVTLFTLPNHTKLIKEFDKKITIKVLQFGGKLGYYLNAPILRRMLTSGKYDLINCHYVSGYGTLTRLANVHPIVASVFGSDVYDYPFKSKNNMKRIIKNLDSAKVITSTSQVMVNKVNEYYKPKNEIFVTHFGVDTLLFKPIEVIVKDSNNSNRSFTFGIIKKLEDKYGIGILIEAFSEFMNSIDDKSDVKLVIYGRGSQLEKYKKIALDLEIQDYVFFKGFIQNQFVPKVLSEIDVVCLPSQIDSESFGVSAVEAMACAKPLIVSDASGFTEVVGNSNCGFIVPKGDVKSLARKMKQCYEMDDNKLEELGLNGYRRVQDLFDFDDNLVTYINAISKAL